MTVHDSHEHTASYYAATANAATDFPRLRGEHHCDVVVVGGGFTGVSTMLHLAERGYDVVLVEANRLGWGASGRNGGQLIDGFVNDDRIEKRFGKSAAEMTHRMGLECRNIVVKRIEQYGIDCDLTYGFIDLALRPADVKEFAERAEEYARSQYPHEIRVVRKDDVPKHVGSKSYIGGLINMGNGHLHPLNLCIGEATAAIELGAKVYEQSRVTRMHHGEKPRVVTDEGSVHAGKIILAGNAYLGRTEPKLSGYVIPAGSYMMATEPLSAALASELLPTNMACCDQRSALDYFRLSADRRMLWGGLCNYSGRRPKNIAASLRPSMLKVFPQLADARIDYQWGGNIAISINRIPQFGRIEGNTYYVQGYSGHGVAPTHIAGKIMADIVGGDSEEFDLFARVKHWYLPGGKWFANPAVALGMLYYRIKELL